MVGVVVEISDNAMVERVLDCEGLCYSTGELRRWCDLC